MIYKKYNTKETYVAFNQDGRWYMYPHNQRQGEQLEIGLMSGSKARDINVGYSWPKTPKNITEHMSQYAI